MEAIELKFRAEKITKNTIRYLEVVNGHPEVVGAIYLQKWYLGDPPPQEVKVTIAMP